jgi:integrase
MITIDQYTAYLLCQDKADNTVRAYRALAQRWCDFALGHNTDPAHPDPATVRAWSQTITSTRSLAAQARAMMGHWCLANHVEDVSAAVIVPRTQRKPKTGWLEPDQAVKLAHTAQGMGLPGLAVLVGMFTAARREEIASLAWENIDWNRKTILLVRRKNRDTHSVHLNSQLAALLVTRRVPGERWVFPGRYGGHCSPATIGTWIDKVVTQAGMPEVTQRWLRRTTVTEIYRMTGDPVVAGDVAGHEKITTTMLYIKKDEHRIAAAVEALYRQAS